MRRTGLACAVVFFGMLSCHAAFTHAAPFCVAAQGMPDECWYYDIRTCKQEAGKKKGYCTVHREEIVAPENKGNFCIVDSSRMPVCAFQSGESCFESAAKRDAICFENVEDGSSDPYRLDPALYQN